MSDLIKSSSMFAAALAYIVGCDAMGMNAEIEFLAMAILFGFLSGCFWDYIRRKTEG